MSFALSTIWRIKGLWLGLIALGCVLYGQQLLVENHDAIDEVIVPSIRWYALGIVLGIVAWWGTYKNKRCVLLPESGIGNRESGVDGAIPDSRFPIPDLRSQLFRYVLAFVALGL